MSGPYRGPIIDAHHHLWDLAMDRHPWLRPTGGEIKALGDLAPIRRNYLVDDYRRDAANQNVAASVHVEAAWDRSDDPLAEIHWLESLDKSSGVAVRYIGFASLAAPNAAETLDRLADVGRCVGVREMLSWHPTQPARNFAAAGRDRRRTGLPPRRLFAVAARSHARTDALPLSGGGGRPSSRRTSPDQRFIVNHCGSPIDRDADGMARWKRGLRLLGRQPNISVKISALTAYDPSPTPESLREVAMHCIESFGVDRSMFGSDFPVGRLWTTFDAIFDGFKAIVQDFSEDEQRALFLRQRPASLQDRFILNVIGCERRSPAWPFGSGRRTGRCIQFGDALGALGGRGNLLGILHRRGDRLLENHRLAGGERVDRRLRYAGLTWRHSFALNLAEASKPDHADASPVRDRLLKSPRASSRAPSPCCRR